MQLSRIALFIILAIFGWCCRADDEEAVLLDGLSDALMAPSLGEDWAKSPDFAIEMWWRPAQKIRDDHEEQCLLSHGNWQGRFKLSLLPWRILRFTVRDNRGAVVDCDGDETLRFERWYHIAASWDSQGGGRASLALNGHPATLKCNPPPRGPANSMSKPANPTTSPLLIGSCSESSGATERARGTVTDLRYWARARSVSQVQTDLFARRLPPDSGGAGWSTLARSTGESQAGNWVQDGDLDGSIPFKRTGNPRWASARRGDQLLSATLTGESILCIYNHS